MPSVSSFSCSFFTVAVALPTPTRSTTMLRFTTLAPDGSPEFVADLDLSWAASASARHLRGEVANWCRFDPGLDRAAVLAAVRAVLAAAR